MYLSKTSSLAIFCQSPCHISAQPLLILSVTHRLRSHQMIVPTYIVGTFACQILAYCCIAVPLYVQKGHLHRSSALPRLKLYAYIPIFVGFHQNVRAHRHCHRIVTTVSLCLMMMKISDFLRLLKSSKDRYSSLSLLPPPSSWKGSFHRFYFEFESRLLTFYTSLRGN